MLRSDTGGPALIPSHLIRLRNLPDLFDTGDQIVPDGFRSIPTWAHTAASLQSAGK